ncbi:type VI secretion system protein ImpK [Sinobacterium caligoides]|uniref:Type VI secretion system protein ImpK n=1 Tax=Sinobacterium caligoides TaxID=933926 RepID=A0A3N2DJT3_9GAMM|nr:type IVB secretion system protein IcmH/DotU [Sinobacterium caligoides]ROS00037.1 type VI secretion system protein ImpK [Sinobacterium caligoides]
MNNQGFTPAPAATGNDRTIMIPTPGGSAHEAPTPQFREQIAPAALQPQEVRQGLSIISNKAATLLTVIMKLRTTVNHREYKTLHRTLCDEMTRFANHCRNASVDPQQTAIAQYILCSAIDEAILKTPWGATCGWANHSLLSVFHNETFGGEKVFALLQQSLSAPAQNIDLLELFYYVLSLGFEGKYRLEHRGFEQLQQIRDSLYQTIESHRQPAEDELSAQWRSIFGSQKGLLKRVPFWIISSVVLALLLVSYSGFQYILHQDTSYTLDLIHQLNVSDQ